MSPYCLHIVDYLEENSNEVQDQSDDAVNQWISSLTSSINAQMQWQSFAKILNPNITLEDFSTLDLAGPS